MEKDAYEHCFFLYMDYSSCSMWSSRRHIQYEPCKIWLYCHQADSQYFIGFQNVAIKLGYKLYKLYDNKS